ncbi:MAG TPA: hypothetical protein VEP90_25220 [Methylomirabilota bacterium]|nr:hypothetical protein [Methylomirabilota bacterium]
MTLQEINTKIENGLEISICPWDVWTNQASATVLEVRPDHYVAYQVDGCEARICRQVSYSTWRNIIEQAQ